MAAALLAGPASQAGADTLFGRSEAEQRRPSWLSPSLERLYEDVRARLAETSARVLETPAVQDAIGQAARVLEAPAVKDAIGQAARVIESPAVQDAIGQTSRMIESPAVQDAIDRAGAAMRSLLDKATHDVIEPLIESWTTPEAGPSGAAPPQPTTIAHIPPEVFQRIAAVPKIDDDPFEPFNRHMFDLNNAIRTKYFDPAADWYFKVTPPPVQQGVRNFFSNLREPVSIVSYLIERKPDQAGVAAARFGINTFLGVAGVYDPATDMGYPSQPRNLEQTLCVAGLPSGPYLVLPILGPATLRDATARIATAVAYYEVMGLSLYVPYRVTDIALQYADIRGQLRSATQFSLDAYTTQRILYLTHRALSCGSLPPEDPDLFPK